MKSIKKRNFTKVKNKEEVIMKICKHKFKPRYNEKWSNPLKDMLCSPNLSKIRGSADTEPYLQEKIYVCDVCIKCGMIVKFNKDLR